MKLYQLTNLAFYRFLCYSNNMKSKAILPEQPPTDGRVVEVMHWNVLHEIPADKIIDVIGNTDPDILLLNETAFSRPRYHNDNLFEKLRDNLAIGGNHAVTETHTLIPKKGDWANKVSVIDGISIFSRFPLSNIVEVELSTGGWDPDNGGKRRTMYLGATLSIDEGLGFKPLDVGTNHRSIVWAGLDSNKNKKNRGIRQRETNKLNEILEGHKTNYIISGDWNATKYEKPIRNIHPNVVRIKGGLDVPTVKPAKKCGIQLPELCIDHIFKTPDISHSESHVGRLGPSDHRPLHVKIKQSSAA